MVAQINITWVKDPDRHVESCPENGPLSASLITVLAKTEWDSPSNAEQWQVKKSPREDPLDKTKSPQDLAIQDGATLYLAKA